MSEDVDKKKEERQENWPKGWFRYVKDRLKPTWTNVHESLEKAGGMPKTPKFRKVRRDLALKLIRTELAGEIDQLTGLLNRPGVERRIREEVGRAKRSGTSFVILLLDLNELKPINDTKGHQAGDELLKATAKILSTEPDSKDGEARAGDIIGRWGGDEFIVVLPETDFEGAKKYWDRKKDQFKSYKNEGLGIKSIWVSAGVALADLEDIKRSIDQADSAMYQAKRMSKVNPDIRENVLQTGADLSNITAA